MDSMYTDLMGGLETSLAVMYHYFDGERFMETLGSGDINGAEAYLFAFTKIDSNFHSNMMIYFLERQKFAMSLIGQAYARRAVLFFPRWRRFSIPETKDFIYKDLDRCEYYFLEYEKVNNGEGSTVCFASVAKCLMNEMLEMMNYLVALNPDLQKRNKSAL